MPCFNADSRPLRESLKHNFLDKCHDSRAHLHHSVPMPQQLPYIAILPARYPDPGEPILHQQMQNMPSIFTIRLLLAYSLRSDLGGVADPQLELQFPQQSLEPPRMPTRFHAHSYLHSPPG